MVNEAQPPKGKAPATMPPIDEEDASDHESGGEYEDFEESHLSASGEDAAAGPSGSGQDHRQTNDGYIRTIDEIVGPRPSNFGKSKASAEWLKQRQDLQYSDLKNDIMSSNQSLNQSLNRFAKTISDAVNTLGTTMQTNFNRLDHDNTIMFANQEELAMRIDDARKDTEELQKQAATHLGQDGRAVTFEFTSNPERRKKSARESLGTRQSLTGLGGRTAPDFCRTAPQDNGESSSANPPRPRNEPLGNLQFPVALGQHHAGNVSIGTPPRPAVRPEATLPPSQSGQFEQLNAFNQQQPTRAPQPTFHGPEQNFGSYNSGNGNIAVTTPADEATNRYRQVAYGQQMRATPAAFPSLGQSFPRQQQRPPASQFER